MNKLLPTFISLILLSIGLMYVLFFGEALSDGEWLNVNGFARIVIPDTFLYKSLVEDDFSISTILITGVKNAIGPAFIWFAALSDWRLVVVINCGIILSTFFYVIHILKYLKVSNSDIRLAIICLGLMPTMIYYSIGALKELPTMLAITAFYYHYIKRDFGRYLLMGAIACIFRYQMFFVFLIFILVDRNSNESFRSSVIILILISMVYPIFKNVELLNTETTTLFREESNSSIGAIIEYVRSNIPIASSLAILIRVLQSIFEPFFPAPDSYWFFESGSISILATSYIISLLIILPFYKRSLSCAIEIIRKPRPFASEISSLYSLIILFLVFSGGFSFVHHRYLFPVTALIVVGGIVDNTIAKKKISR